MQIRIALIPLITSTFVLYVWGLPDKTFMFLSIKPIYLKLYFENMLGTPYLPIYHFSILFFVS
jgi:hypothetical protein